MELTENKNYKQFSLIPPRAFHVNNYSITTRCERGHTVFVFRSTTAKISKLSTSEDDVSYQCEAEQVHVGMSVPKIWMAPSETSGDQQTFTQHSPTQTYTHMHPNTPL